LRSALVEAIEGGRIDVALQPIVRLRDGALVGVEALARWTDAALGAIPPRRFVDEAERSLLIRSLGRAVRAAAYRAADRVAAETGTEVRVALNVSARELSDPTLATVVTGELRRIGWTPERLELEVTETAAITDDDVVHANLTALRSTGVRVAIDDFGTGYASLEQLQRIPADVLKIDRAFVTPLGGDDASATALVRATVQIGRAFGLEVLAEGVETEAQWEALAQIGCDLAQGFLVAPPMDLASFLGWWSARRATVGNAVTR
jgi:EAL domain-containing protein (putative c-di-GMP-specific phosphodiesterase class I)